jgi:hypothetical protein
LERIVAAKNNRSKTFPHKYKMETAKTYTCYLRMHGDTILYVRFDRPEDPSVAPTRFYEVSEDAIEYVKERSVTLEDVCRLGWTELATFMVERGAVRVNEGLRGACEGGYMDLVELMIGYGASYWNWALEGASKGGHLELLEQMIEYGGEDYPWDMILAVRAACIGGHVDILKHLVRKYPGKCPENYWDRYLVLASANGHVHCMDWIVNKMMFGAISAEVWSDALDMACRGRHLATIDYILSNCTWDKDLLERGLFGACKARDLDTVKRFLSKDGEVTDNLLEEEWDAIYACAYEGGDARVIAHLRGMHPKVNYNLAFIGACQGGHVDLVKEIPIRVKEEPFQTYEPTSGEYSNALSKWAYMDGFMEACLHGHIDVMKHLEQHRESLGVTINMADLIDTTFPAVCMKNDLRMARYMLGMVADVLFGAVDNATLSTALNKALDISYLYGYMELFNLCIAHGARISRVNISPYIDAVRRTLSNVRDLQPELKAACRSGFADIAMLLMDYVRPAKNTTIPFLFPAKLHQLNGIGYDISASTTAPYQELQQILSNYVPPGVERIVIRYM